MNQPTPVPCTWWENTGHLVLYLRRYASESKCPGRRGYHAAMAYCGGVDRPPDDTRWRDVPELNTDTYAGDPRWPEQCDECTYRFLETDTWQVFTDNVMRDAAGATLPQNLLPVGAMYDASWYPEKGPDGIALVVVCPPRPECHNVWHVDGGAYKDGKVTHPAPAWSRTGDPRNPPTLTCNPSIEIGFARNADGQHVAGGPCYYHGFLRAGVLTPG